MYHNQNQGGWPRGGGRRWRGNGGDRNRFNNRRSPDRRQSPPRDFGRDQYHQSHRSWSPESSRQEQWYPSPNRRYQERSSPEQYYFQKRRPRTPDRRSPRPGRYFPVFRRSFSPVQRHQMNRPFHSNESFRRSPSLERNYRGGSQNFSNASQTSDQQFHSNRCPAHEPRQFENDYHYHSRSPSFDRRSTQNQRRSSSPRNYERQGYFQRSSSPESGSPGGYRPRSQSPPARHPNFEDRYPQPPSDNYTPMRSLKSPEIDPIDFDRLRIELLKPEPVYVYRRQLEPIPNQQNNVIDNEPWVPDTAQANDVPSCLFHTNGYKNAIKSRPMREICNESYVNRKIRRPCVFCNKQHSVDECHEITNVEKRREFLEDAGICTRCLGRHSIRNCFNRAHYECDYCSDEDPDVEPHHSCLCPLPGTKTEFVDMSLFNF
ncbi:Patterned Expression Site [Caenorhabditis elegans]|nr:Patterned Expression Site [Caenorhabditis elegans]CAC15861.1 Patterned Expression Site [Caenorhabditis elegans]|eukprot:NP_001254318.1 Patterned Expression Site [Caenorhabditis elegans]